VIFSQKIKKYLKYIDKRKIFYYNRNKSTRRERIYAKVSDCFLLLLLVTSVISDVQTRKVPNWLIGIGLLSGLYFQILAHGVSGIGVFLGNMMFPILILYLLFLMRALGAGDIKLFSVIGVCSQFSFLMHCMCWAFMIGAVLALGRMIRNRNFMQRMFTFVQFGQQTIRERRILAYPYDNDGKENRIYFSVAILLGFLLEWGVCNLG
jgi:prepilin peptidase CpaA